MDEERVHRGSCRAHHERRYVDDDCPAKQREQKEMTVHTEARREVFDDLAAEAAALDAVLTTLPDEAWLRPSAAASWTVADVMLHLAQTEEMAAAACGGQPPRWRGYGDTVDAAMDALVRSERLTPQQILTRWRAAGRASLTELRRADPGQRLGWVASTVKPATLATTRLAEHWAHALDIVEPLGIDYPDTARLRHIAWLGHSTLPYAFRLAGRQPREVYCELAAPDGATWTFGDADAGSSITGSAAAFCRVGAQRLAPHNSGLVARGPDGHAALHVLRNYAATAVD
jgi:uncharacterized protein (TIGR03084 family)